MKDLFYGKIVSDAPVFRKSGNAILVEMVQIGDDVEIDSKVDSMKAYYLM